MADSALDIRFVQALLLDSLYSEGLDNSSVHSALTGEAVALTLTTGMHRCGDDLWEMGPIVSEERKRFCTSHSLRCHFDDSHHNIFRG